MPNRKRKELTGRGAVGKTAVVGAKDRETNRVSAQTVAHRDALHLSGSVASRTRDGAKAYTDDAAAYAALDPFYDHESVNHSAGEYVRGAAHTNGIESLWSMLKRGYYGTYHHMSPKHLDRYIAEFAGRHNMRDADTLDQMTALVAASVGKRLIYRDLIAE